MFVGKLQNRAVEPFPCFRDLVAIAIQTRRLVAIQSDAQPIKDETGNLILDENGNIVHGE